MWLHQYISVVVMPGYSTEQRDRLMLAAIELSEEGEWFSNTDLRSRSGVNYDVVKSFMSHWGPDGPQMTVKTRDGWKTKGAGSRAPKQLTTTGIMIFNNLIGNLSSAEHLADSVFRTGEGGSAAGPTKSPNDIDLSEEQQVSTAIDILIKRYESHWPGHNTLDYEWMHWPEWFLLNRLGWLVSSDFYYPCGDEAVNREGSRSTVYGWQNSEPTVPELISAAKLILSEQN